LEQGRSFCNLLGKPALADDAELATFEGRVARRDEISPVFKKVLSARTALVWQQLLDQAGVPAEISVDTLGGSTFLHDADNVRLGLVAIRLHHWSVSTPQRFSRALGSVLLRLKISSHEELPTNQRQTLNTRG
jgi:crotonobetainyl-CoA:carnitine CoA-transferase CaiB-like acyl-CoA transferase